MLAASVPEDPLGKPGQVEKAPHSIAWGCKTQAEELDFFRACGFGLKRVWGLGLFFGFGVWIFFFFWGGGGGEGRRGGL